MTALRAPAPLLVGDVFGRGARRTPDRVAASLDGRIMTFAELDRTGILLAARLSAQGVGPGDRVAWWGDTTLDAAPLFVAVARLGAVFAPISAGLSPKEAAPVLALADACLIVTDEARCGHGDATVEALTEAAMASGRSAREPPDRRPDRSPDVTHHGGWQGAAPRETDAHVIFFTSGSTGRPKGVVLSHRVNVLRTMPANGSTPAGATVCMFPMFHMAAWTIALGCWQAGEEVSFVKQADAGTLLGTVEARRARRLYAIPAVWSRILAELRSGPAGAGLSSLREVDTGTSATPPELIAALSAALPGTTTRVMYGSTEAGPGAVLGPDDALRKPGSVGLPAAGVEVRIDEGGEIWLRSPFLMSGYFRDPEATGAALVEGWYRTGDLGVLDEEGYLSVVGRAGELIRTGGEAVAPVEVEEAVASHPAVAEVAVVGVADAEWGQLVCAVVVLEPGTQLDLRALRSHCAGRLAKFKQPRRLAVVAALPRTAATGQIQRSLMAERLALDGQLE